MRLGKKSQLRMLGPLKDRIEAAKNKMIEYGMSVTITPNVIRCEGSPNHPKCRLPLTLNIKQVEARDKILKTFLEDSKNCVNKCHLSINDFKNSKVGDICPKCGGQLIPDEEDRNLGSEFLGQCYLCICEHPEVKQYLNSKVYWSMMKTRPLLEKQYASGE